MALFVLKIRFIIDTEEAVFVLSQRPLYTVQALTYPENPAKLKVVVFGIPFTLDFFKMAEKRKKQQGKDVQEYKSKKRVRKSKKKTPEIGIIFRVLLDAINIKYMYSSLDTEDFAFNAKLFPAVYLLNQNTDDRFWFEINFTGESYLKTQIESRPIWVVLAFIKLKRNQNKIKQYGI